MNMQKKLAALALGALTATGLFLTAGSGHATVETAKETTGKATAIASKIDSGRFSLLLAVKKTSLACRALANSSL